MDRATTALCLSCVMPAFNEADALPAVLAEALAALKALAPAVELIVVDDGSSDATADVVRGLCAREPALRLLQLSRNFGKEAALTAGLAAARGDVVVLMDADGQHPTALLATMAVRWRDGADVVYAVRTTRDDQSTLHRRLTQLFYRVVNWGSRVRVPADAGDFRWLDRRAVDALLSMPERHRFMKGLYAWVGFRREAIPYQPLARRAGRSHFGLRGAFGLGTTGLLAFTAVPLRLLGLLGGLLALGALAYGMWVVIEYFWLGIDVPGYATLAAGMMLLSGVQLMSIGLLAEYVARIYDEVKQRPLYLVMSEAGQGLPTAAARAPASAEYP